MILHDKNGKPVYVGQQVTLGSYTGRISAIGILNNGAPFIEVAVIVQPEQIQLVEGKPKSTFHREVKEIVRKESET